MKAVRSPNSSGVPRRSGGNLVASDSLRLLERAAVALGQPLGREAAGGDRVHGDPVGGDLASERLRKPTAAIRVELESASPGIGSRIDETPR